jgi:PAS domain S-box-containing protein
VESPVERVLREGVIVGLATHTALVNRDGKVIPIDDSGAPVRDEHNAIGAVLVFRDVTDRRKVLRTIQESQQNLELALDAGRMATWEWEIGTGAAGFEALQPDMHPDDRQRVLATAQNAAASRGDYRVEYRIVRPDGGIAWLEARGRLVLDDKSEPERIVGVRMDVTQRKLAEESLRGRLAQQNAIARLGALALSSRDPAKLQQTAVSVVANELGVEFCSLLESAPNGNDLILRAGHGWPEFPKPGQIVKGGRESQAGYTLLSGGPVVMEALAGETRFVIPPVLAELGVASGISVVIPGTDRPFGVLAAFSMRHRAFTADDTQFLQAVANIVANALRRQGEEEVRERLAAVLESSGDAIAAHDLQGVVESWNRGAEHVYGYTAQEMIGRSGEILVPSDRASEEAAILELVSRGEAVPPFETARVRKDGTQIQVSLTISPIRDRSGRIIGTAYSGRDISERKRVEEKLQQTQKLESLGILAGGIAHDFNNLLTGILGNASLMTELVTSSPARELAESVIQAAERAAHLTRQMLAYSGRGRFLIQPMHCSQQVREITALIAASIPKNVQVRLALADDLPLIEADAGQFQQLVMNLVINGAEAVGSARGVVTISTGVEQIEEREIAGMTFGGDLKPGRYVSLEVRDSGCGMDADTLARIFDPFFTTKFTGRGLGLAAVLGIVRGHQGGVNVRSAPGRGTVFQVLFPLAIVQKQEPKVSPPEPQFSADTILIVDDEQLVRRAAQVALEKYGYTTLLAEDGQRAVELFRSKRDEIAVVLLDMTMPVMSGEETFQELRKIRPDVAVIASSGYSEAEAMARFGRGIAGFVQKPYTASTLAARVAEVMAGRRRVRGAG